MRIDVVTLFPEMVEHAAQFGVVGRALTKTLWSLTLWNPRTYTSDPHRTVDDRPYGGGPGMVMLAAPLAETLKAARAAQAEAGCAASRVLYLSPAGVPLTHARVTALNALAQQGTGLILLAGRYEGIDERLLAREVDEEIAVGDFVVSGGELPAMMLIDALVRQLPGALNDAVSAEEESFVDGLLDCPHYTRPPVHEGEAVPEVLLSGDHAAIAQWRRMQALGRTAERRPDLLAQRTLTKEEARLLETYRQTCGET
ncbi:MAG: tRNA (guanosine(37)-N1)-methyltransferase TrmD [Burkholderiales bacterium]|jgi:tRNA (guanine37-N1)-methyltransferase|nr:tRNA (guanosine(37)-N1)-methyltransferase TrmD [Burkholderiales bacterium]